MHQIFIFWALILYYEWGVRRWGSGFGYHQNIHSPNSWKWYAQNILRCKTDEIGIGKRGLKPTANYAYSFSVGFVMVIFLWTYLHRKPYIISIWTHLYVKRLIMAGVILGENCVWLLDATLDDLVFQKFVLWKVVQIWYEHRGCWNQSCLFAVIYREKVPCYISARHFLHFLK